MLRRDMRGILGGLFLTACLNLSIASHLTCNPTGKVLDEIEPTSLALKAACKELAKDAEQIATRMERSDPRIVTVGYEAWRMSKPDKQKGKEIFTYLQRHLLEKGMVPLGGSSGSAGETKIFGTIMPFGPAYVISLNYLVRAQGVYFLTVVFAKSTR